MSPPPDARNCSRGSHSKDVRRNHGNERVHLFLAISNVQVALPGACTKNNDWTLPGDWTAEEILEKLLVYVVYDQHTADKILERDDAGEVRISDVPVSVVFTCHGEIAQKKCPLHQCSVDGAVKVHLAHAILPFVGLADACTGPLMDLTEVHTPPSPTWSDGIPSTD